MRKLICSFFILIVVLNFTACKSTSSPIVTSKKEAEKRGTYAPVVKSENNTVRRETETRRNNSKSESRVSKEEVSHRNNTEEFSLANQIIATAMQYEGVKYRTGGMSHQGMDCSGLVNTSFKASEIQLPRISYEIAKVGEKINLNEVQKGDLVFFKTNGRSQINHVGLVTEVRDGEVLFIHASVQRGVIVSSMHEPYYKKTFAQANRVLQ